MAISPAAVSAVFLFGLAVGSFLNVCIWRLPAGEQVVKGRSHCRGCGRMIAWYDNIPLWSFFRLKGRCRSCGSRISWSYPAVELATGLLLAAVVLRFGWTGQAAVYGFLAAALLMISVIDWKEMIIPDEVTLPGISLGAVLSFYLPELHGAATRWGGLMSAVAGALAGAGTLWIIGVIGRWLFRKEAMGFGDVKLMAMVGAILGIPKVLLVNLLLAPMAGAAIGLILKIRFGRELIPFGPFLALGTMAAVFWGDALIAWYLNLLRGV